MDNKGEAFSSYHLQYLVDCLNNVFFNTAKVDGDISWNSVFKQLLGVGWPLDPEADLLVKQWHNKLTFYKAIIDFMFCI